MIQYKHLLNPLKEKSKLHEREREKKQHLLKKNTSDLYTTNHNLTWI